MESFLKTPTAIRQQVDQYEYLLAVNTTAELEKRVEQDRADLRQYGYVERSNTKPMITIARFTAKEAMEDTLIRYIQRVCSAQPSFNAHVNNYGGFPPATLYLRIQEKAPFIQLAKALEVINSYVNSCACPDVWFTTSPHITIAHNLDQSLYMTALLDFSQKSFYENFEVNELILLRRSNSYDTAKKVNVFYLGHHPQN